MTFPTKQELIRRIGLSKLDPADVEQDAMRYWFLKEMVGADFDVDAMMDQLITDTLKQE